MAEPTPSPKGDEPLKVGVYVCHCGGNISDVVEVADVVSALAQHPLVTISRHFPFMCSDPGQALVIDDIKANGINRVVVAACSPTLHENTFRSALERAGLNPYLYEHVNLREQVSWVHKGDHEGATQKAIRLVAAGVEKVARQDALQPIEVDVERHVVVIGGGVAGMRSALALARHQIGVTLVEKTATLGGRVRELETVFPTEESSAALVDELELAVRRDERIELLTSSEVLGMDGHVGKFKVTVRTATETKSVPAGAIITATGFDHYQPEPDEYGYGSPAVVTLPQFNELLAAQPEGAKLLTRAGKPLRRVAFIHCVGSREIDGVHQPHANGKVNDYCSRTCCTATLHAIHRLLDRCPETTVYDLNKDIRTYGRGHEDYYDRASQRGVMFFRFPDEEPPQFEAAPNARGGTLTFRDRLTWGEEINAPVDLVVLATGMRPRDISDLISLRKLPVGTDDFLQEVHPKLRPVEMGIAGVMLAGTCQGPMDIGEVCAAGETAAAKAAILLSRPVIELDPFVARVDPEKCDGCALCLEECSYKGALELVDGKAVVTPALCVGCGACAAVCPTRALNVAGWSLDQFDAMVDAIIADEPLVPVLAAVGIEAEEVTEPESRGLSSAQVKEMVAAAREQHGAATPQQLERGKADKQLQRQLLEAVATEAKTVPDIAAETGVPEQDVLWWMTALKKYGRVQDESRRGGPVSYRKK